MCLVVRVQGWGRGWKVRKNARVAKTMLSKAAWALWTRCRFELRVLESTDTDHIQQHNQSSIAQP